MAITPEQFQEELFKIGTSPFDIGSTPDFKLMYQTAFGAQYLALMQNLEAIMGYVPNLSDPATLNTLVQAGVIDLATAQKLGDLNAPVFSKTGTLNAEFARRGGGRALEGPFLAKQAEVLKGFQKALQMASLQSTGLGMQFAQNTRGQNITALDAGGRQAVGLRQIQSAEGGPGELTPEQLAALQPPQPVAPKEPGFMDRHGGAIFGAALTGLAPILRDYLRGDGSYNLPPSSIEPPPEMPTYPEYGFRGDSGSFSDYLRSQPYDYSGGGYSYSQPQYSYPGSYYDQGYQDYSYDPGYSYQDYYDPGAGYGGSYYDTGYSDYSSYDPGYSYDYSSYYY